MNVQTILNELMENSDQLNGTLKTVLYSLLAVMLIISLLQCFFGYKLIKLWISIGGFFVGCLMGALIAIILSEQSAWAVILTILIFGALGAWLAFKFFKVGVFLECFALGFVFGAILGYYFGKEQAIAPAGLLFALAAGILGVILIKPVFILTTGISGGTSAGSCLAILGKWQNPDLAIIVGLVIAALGIYVQFMMNRKKPKNPQVPQNGFSEPAVTAANFQTSGAGESNPQETPSQEEEHKCPGCGRPYSQDEKFCPGCGHPLS